MRTWPPRSSRRGSGTVRAEPGRSTTTSTTTRPHRLWKTTGSRRRNGRPDGAKGAGRDTTETCSRQDQQNREALWITRLSRETPGQELAVDALLTRLVTRLETVPRPRPAPKEARRLTPSPTRAT